MTHRPLAPTAAERLVEQGLGRIEGRVRRRRLAVVQAATTSARILHRVDGVHLDAAAFELDPRGLAQVDEAAAQRDDATGEVSTVDFVVLAADGDGAVATDAAADAGSERRAQLRLVEGVGG